MCFFSIKSKNISATLDGTSKLNDGLNQTILRCPFLLMLFCSWLGRAYVSFVACPHFFSASSYSNLVLLNISALEEFRDNLSLIIFVSCFLICGGWFDDTSMYINLSFGILYGRSYRKGQRKIIWFNPPLNLNVPTNVADIFLDLIEKHFPRSNKLHKILKKNTVKVNYSCTQNMTQII